MYSWKARTKQEELLACSYGYVGMHVVYLQTPLWLIMQQTIGTTKIHGWMNEGVHAYKSSLAVDVQQTMMMKNSAQTWEDHSISGMAEIGARLSRGTERGGRIA
jgi:hypothetical protein